MTKSFRSGFRRDQCDCRFIEVSRQLVLCCVSSARGVFIRMAIDNAILFSSQASSSFFKLLWLMAGVFLSL